MDEGKWTENWQWPFLLMYEKVETGLLLVPHANAEWKNMSRTSSCCPAQYYSSAQLVDFEIWVATLITGSYSLVCEFNDKELLKRRRKVFFSVLH